MECFRTTQGTANITKIRSEGLARLKAWNKGDKGRAYRRARKDMFITLARDIKTKAKMRPCMDCNGDFATYQMDFDHGPMGGRNGKIHIGRLNAKAVCSWKALGALKREIEACDVVCSNCHRSRTFNRGEYKHD